MTAKDNKKHSKMLMKGEKDGEGWNNAILTFEELMDDLSELNEQNKKDLRYADLRNLVEDMHGFANVTAFLERLSGKTHLLHLSGSDRNIKRYLDELHKRRDDAMDKWIVVPYVGVWAKWKFKQKARSASRW